MMSEGMDEKRKMNRWWVALAALVVEVGFTLLMLSLSSDGDLDSDGRKLAIRFSILTLLTVIALYRLHKDSILSVKIWRIIAIVSTIACFACSGLLPMLNHTLVDAFLLLSLGLAAVSFTAIFLQGER
jgi:hypothetical protein